MPSFYAALPTESRPSLDSLASSNSDDDLGPDIDSTFLLVEPPESPCPTPRPRSPVLPILVSICFDAVLDGSLTDL
jgi:hypothetical protein